MSLLEENAILLIASHWTRDSEPISIDTNTFAADLEMVNETLFTSTLSINNNDTTNSGEYACIADAEITHESSARTTIQSISSVALTDGRFPYSSIYIALNIVN